MGTPLKLAGQIFGFWTVESYAGSRYWWCICECGERSKVHAGNLTRGDSRSCGCKNLKLKDISGQRFGRWVAVSYDKVQQKWLCRCDCGNERFVVSENIRSGKTNSCGCNTRSLPGTRYGHWTLLKFLGKDLWEAQCDCGNKDTKKETSLRVGCDEPSCGCVALARTEALIRQLEIPKPKHSPLLKDLAGIRIGKVVPLEYAGSGKWICQCDCGVKKPLSIGGLRTGKTKSCGCERVLKTVDRNKSNHRSTREDLTNRRFGKMLVLRASQYAWKWICRCDCGAEKTVQHHNLTRGTTRSCGCLVRETNARFRRYENLAERKRLDNDRKRQRRDSDEEYAAHVRRAGRLSALRTRRTPAGKARMALVHAKRRSQCSGPGVSAQEWLLVLEAWRHKCAYCQKPGPLTQDHVLALSCGGTHDLDNVVPACKRCNCRKSVLELAEALERLGSTNFHERREAATLFLKEVIQCAMRPS